MISVRLDRKTEAWLKRLARQQAKTASEVVRESLALYGRQEEKIEKAGTSLYDRISHLIGIAKGGPRDLSTRSKEHFEKILREKHKRRHAR